MTDGVISRMPYGRALDDGLGFSIGTTAPTAQHQTIGSAVEPSEGFLAGNVLGRTRVNTPSLRGTWSTPTYLPNAPARSLREAILAPGHAALRAGERALAVASDESIDVHGVTSSLTAQESTRSCSI
jgi:hypothetical protein